ncbi:diiron oxygenase [Photorhabdus bodei]|uniref:Aminobenzoate oxygenase n=1 Tax=Photorhabdus bodei TaxID=2029681 RepID=A0A329X505_9GAMM|nr:diiron oxygenase [Photorhabdus bodei]NDL01336.1 hypothetical protein [Photorhabdus bodei]NDL05625.1 hypothetical protein [Photorhabdus bodei]NDL09838.1 hypothetical protein [Photorhabdus bodei]RAX11525.1 hypothetical protein CKY02_13115 [Photorhabdus bodei]
MSSELIGNVLSKGGLLSSYTAKWEQRASIRTRPEKYIDFDIPGFFFPEEKQPLLLDESLQHISYEIKNEILIQAFFKYLNDIINLEIKLINSACNKIIYNDLSVKYHEQMKINAYTIVIDEYYHVYIARNMMNQLKAKFPDIKELSYPISDAYVAVSEIMSRLSPRYHDLFEIIAVCIFETTLVKELVEFFNSENVHPSIKYYVNDHMNDESRHYLYFHELLQYTWHHMSDDETYGIGQHIADFVKLYLNIESEKQFNTELLSSITNDRAYSEKSVQRIYQGFEVTPDVPIVKNVLLALKRAGVLEHQAVRRGFENIGWVIS